METTRQNPVNMLAQSNLAVLSQKNKKPSNQWSSFTDLADHLSADFSDIFCEHSWVPAQWELLLTISLH